MRAFEIDGEKYIFDPDTQVINSRYVHLWDVARGTMERFDRNIARLVAKPAEILGLEYATAKLESWKAGDGVNWLAKHSARVEDYRETEEVKTERRMSEWDPFHGWMAFRNLRVDIGLSLSFTIGYKITDDGADEWTARFIRFKEKKPVAIQGGLNLVTTAVPLLVKHLELVPSQTGFMPALSSNEIVASDGGVLSVLARASAQASSAKFVPSAITKKAHQPLHYVSSAETRRKILDGAEYKSSRIEAQNILIFDDFITTGDTLSHIARAIREVNKGITVYGVALGKELAPLV